MDETDSYLVNRILERIQVLGEIKAMLYKASQASILQDLNNYNGYWTSENKEASEKLENTRMQLLSIEQILWDAQEKIDNLFE